MTNKLKLRALRLFRQILFGTLLSGTMFFQSVGYISAVFADEATLNSNVDVTTGATLASGDGATGLTGPNDASTVSTSKTISISGGATGIVGVLDKTSSDPTQVKNGVSLSLNENGALVVGDASDSASLGTLTVAGNGTRNPSTLTVKDGATVSINAGGLLEIGGESGSGAVVLENGSTLSNAGVATSASKLGIVVGTQGKLTVGSETAKTTGTIIDGAGTLANQGTVSIYNETGAANGAVFGVYSDVSTAVLTSTGAVAMNAGSGTGGALTISGALSAAEWSTLNDATFSSTSDVNIFGLATLGSLTDGASLTVASPNVLLGGLKAFSVVDSSAARTGGKLTINSNSAVQITGLDAKMNAAGEVDSENGLYDVWLGSNFSLAGELVSAKADSDDPTSLGMRWLGKSTIDSTGSLFADDLTISVGSDADDGATSLQNTGSLIVNGELAVALEDSAKSFTLTNLAVAASKASIGVWTLGANQSFVNGVVDNTTTKASISIGKMALSGGSFKALGVSTAVVDELTIDQEGADGTQTAFQTDNTAVVTLNSLNLIQGLAVLESSSNAGGLASASNKTTYTIGKAGTDHYAQLQILGTDATFGAGTLTLEGQGLLVQETGHTLTFNNTSVVNNSERTGDLAQSISADALVFSGTASYSGGQTIKATSATFKTGTTLNLGVDDPLTIAKDGSLTLEKGAALNVEFAADGSGVGTAVLSGKGLATLAEGSVVKASNISKLADGTYSGVAIQTENDANVFAASTEETAFYQLNATASNDGKSLNLELNLKNQASSFAKTANETAVAEYVDKIRTDENVSDDLRTTLDEFLTLKSDAEVAATLNSLGGVHRANSLALAMNSPWRQAFDNTTLQERRAYSDGYLQQSAIGGVYRGQVPNGYAGGGDVYAENGLSNKYVGNYNGYNGYNGAGFGVATPRSAWYSQNYRGTEAKSDGNSDEFGTSEVGMNVGYEAVRASGIVAGLAFGYSQPHLYSDSARTTASNFQLGLYGGGSFGNGWETKFYVGGGVQDYTSKRIATIGEAESYHRATFGGQSFAAALQLGRPYQLGALSLLRPVVQFDVEQVWQDGATESGDGSALVFEDADWNRAFGRVGLEYEFNGPFLLFNARTLYGVQLGGDSAPTSEFKFAGFQSGAQTATVCGVDQGDAFFDAGIGANGYLDCDRNWTLGGSYDFVSSDKTTSHVGSVSLVYLF